MKVHKRRYTILLLALCSAIALGAPVPLSSKILEEANLRHSAFSEKADGIPTFGLEQLQHAANLMHTMWHHAEGLDNRHEANPEMPTINFARTEPSVGIMNKHVTRDIEATQDELSQFCGLGVPSYSILLQNTCRGLSAFIETAICTNGSEVTTVHPNATNIFTFPWPQCEITQVVTVSTKYKLVNLKEQYGVSNCTLVPGSIVCANNINCFVQLICANFTNFGYNAWGLQCETDTLMCGNVVVPPAQFSSNQSRITNGECRVVQHGCAETTSATINSTRLNLTCGFDEDLGTSGNCQLQRFNVPCSQPLSNYTNCNISEVLCNGVVYPTNEPVANQAQCTVNSITCDGGSDTPTSSCVPQEMTCNGTPANFSTYTGALSGCSIHELRCMSQGTCTSLQFACPGAPKCSFSQQSVALQCVRTLNTSACACPNDYTGRYCDSMVPIDCSASLVHPIPSCIPSPLGDPNDSLLDGDRKCTVYNDYNADVNLGFRLNCAYATPINTSSPLNFTYWANNSKIAISLPVNWTMRHKVFNFKQFSDMGQVMYVGNFTVGQVLGQEPLWFNFSLHNIPDRFWFARRLYYELRFSLGGFTAFRAFIDAPTRPISTATMQTLSTFSIVLILIGIAVFLILFGYVGYRCYRRYQKQKPKKQKY